VPRGASYQTRLRFGSRRTVRQLERASSFRTLTSSTLTATPVGGHTLSTSRTSFRITRTLAARFLHLLCHAPGSHIVPTSTPSETRRIQSSNATRSKPVEAAAAGSPCRSPPVLKQSVGVPVARKDERATRVGCVVNWTVLTCDPPQTSTPRAKCVRSLLIIYLLS
jgi:hypothetical protein